MDRLHVNATIACAAALVIAVLTPTFAGDVRPPTRGSTEARSSLLRLIRRFHETTSSGIQVFPIEPIADSESIAESQPWPAESKDVRPSASATLVVEFVRSDSGAVRRVVFSESPEVSSSEEEMDHLGPPLPMRSEADDAAQPALTTPLEVNSTNQPAPRTFPSGYGPDTTSEFPPRQVSPMVDLPALPVPKTVSPFEPAVPGEDGVGAPTPLVVPAVPAASVDIRPWWDELVLTPLRDSEMSLPVQVNLLVCQALQHSPQVMMIQTDPLIRHTQIVQEQARFDWKTFLETRYDDISDPVGSTLTTGGPSRYRDQKWTAAGGLRRQTALGSEVELSQRMGWEDSNSRFFVPSPQRTARLELSFTQPLLQGAGRAYNESRVVLAQIGTNASYDEVQGQLQDHLLRVATTYWELYRARVIYLQRIRFLDNSEQILETLEGRQEVDAMRQQILRARAAVASRRASLARSAAEIRDAESRLKLLVNHPALLESESIEIIPDEHPIADYIPLCRTDSLNVALMHRPDISRATREIRAAGVRLGVAENELLPRLDLILSSYLYGLDGKNIPQAYSSQYDTGRPSFAAGFKFEMPLGNRAALAREDQRQWEMSRAMHEYRAVVDTGMTEVDLALREVETAYLEMMARAEAMEFARQETDYLKERWVWLGGADRTAAALLEELLLSQERLVDEEEAFITAQVRYVIALSEVRRALGTLMMCTPANPNAPAAVAPFTAAPAAVDPSADPFGGQSPSAVPPELPSAPMPGFEAEMQPSPAPAGVQVN